MAPPWRHRGATATIQIENVPPDTHAVLTRRAAAAHQSLQAYLLDELRSRAEPPTLDEVLASLEGVGGGSLSVETAVGTLREDRARRWSASARRSWSTSRCSPWCGAASVAAG